MPDLAEIDAVALSELVRQGQKQHDGGRLMPGRDAKDVPADALGLARFVQQPIAERFFQRGRYNLDGELFGFGHG